MMNLSKTCFLIVLFVHISIITSPAHKFYVSLVVIDYNHESEVFEITMKIFTDDLELGLLGFSNEKIRINAQNQTEHNLNHAIQNYIASGFQLQIDNKKLDTEYLGIQNELDVTWVFLETEKVMLPKKLYIENSLLTEIYSDQSNIIQLNAGSIKKGILTTHLKPAGYIIIDE